MYSNAEGQCGQNVMSQNVSIVIGAQWGDEGKGKWVDILAQDADLVARFQGGNNAGHTLYVQGEKVVLHQIPSGLFQGKVCALTAGVVVNPVELVGEMHKVRKFQKLTPDNFWLSARANVITPWHIYLDGADEATRAQPIGTTKRGIGPTYAAKVSRTGLRLGHFLQKVERDGWVNFMRGADKQFAQFYAGHTDLWQAFHAAADELVPFVCDSEQKIRSAMRSGKNLLLEGAQGALLDIDHGTYPFVTSSSTAAGGALASLGFSPKRVRQILGVAKAYTTRVGSGPFPTELFDHYGKSMAQKGNEFGATTGRPRRCGWLDAVALKYAVEVNGLDGVILNKLDILSGFDQVKLAVAYEHKTLGRLADFPWDAKILSECEPVYQTFAGWQEEVQGGGKIDAVLPAAAKAYIHGVEDAIGCPVAMVGTGVHRQDALYR